MTSVQRNWSNERGVRMGAIAVALITVAAGGLELFLAMNPVYGYDEAWHTYQARVLPAWKAMLAASADQHPFLYYLLLRPFAALGTEPLYPRLLSVLATVLTLPLWYLLLRRLRINIATAVAATAVLAVSYSFLHIGIAVRAYALTVLLLLGGLWFWTELLPGGPRAPGRRSSILSLALFSAASWCLYAAAFATSAIFGATLLVMLLSGDARRTITDNLKRCSRWPEWALFFALHIACVLWYWIGWMRHVDANAPSHVAHLTRADGQTVLDYLHIALRNELNLLTPLTGLDDRLIDAGAIAILLLILALTWHYLRHRRAVLAVLALTPLVLTAILALLGTLGIYPFGGYLRHQYVLFPFLLMLVPLGLNAVWSRLPNLAVKGALLTVVIVAAAGTSLRTYQDYGFIGDSSESLHWDDKFATLFATGGDKPVFIPSFTFFPVYVDRMGERKYAALDHGEPGIWYLSSYKSDPAGYHVDHQGYLTIAMPWPAYETFGATADDGSEMLIVKDQYRWHFDAVPDALFFKQLREMLEALGYSGARVFSPKNHDDAPPSDEPGLRAAAAANGFELSSFEPMDTGAIWGLDLANATPNRAADANCR